jgi:hypothetical protein
MKKLILILCRQTYQFSYIGYKPIVIPMCLSILKYKLKFCAALAALHREAVLRGASRIAPRSGIARR